jgi:hypothetical protein
MAIGTALVLALWLLVGLGGLAAHVWDIAHHWRARTPFSTRRNALYRLLWLEAMGLLGAALATTEELGLATVLWWGVVWLGLAAWMLFCGYRVDRQYNRTVLGPGGGGPGG